MTTLTHEQIEAARDQIGLALTLYPDKRAQDDIAKAFVKLDALCAAARQPEDLVGKRVKITDGLCNGKYGEVDRFTAAEYEVIVDGTGFEDVETLYRWQFEPLEDGND